MKTTIALIMAILLSACSSYAAFSKNDAGTSTAQFLKMGVGARAAGMGEAYTAVTDTAESIYWNPAGLAAVVGKSLSVMHAIWFEDISYDWASYAQNIEGIGTVGIGVQYLSYGSITETDVSGLDVGNFSPNDLAAALSWGHMVRKVSVGVNVKYITSHIKNTANAVALDLGTQYALNGNLTLGAAIQNLGSKMKFVSEEDSLPLVTRMGAAYALSDDWTAAFDISAPIDYEPSFALGTEYRYQISGQMSAAGRVGYNSKGKETGGLNGVGMGIGLTCLNYGIDYALVTFGELGNGHRISFSFHF